MDQIKEVDILSDIYSHPLYKKLHKQYKEEKEALKRKEKEQQKREQELKERKLYEELKRKYDSVPTRKEITK